MVARMYSLIVVLSFVTTVFGQYGGYGYGGYGGGYGAGYGAAGYGTGYGAAGFAQGDKFRQAASTQAVGNQFLAANNGYKQAVAQDAAVHQAFNVDQVAKSQVEAYQCAAYICVEFSDIHSSGVSDQLSIYDTSVSAADKAKASQLSDVAAFQSAFARDKAFENGVQSSSAFGFYPYYSAGYGVGYDAGFSSDYGAAQGLSGLGINEAAAASSRSGFARATNKYNIDASNSAASGKQCKKYVCASSLSIDSLARNGPNYVASADASAAAANSGYSSAKAANSAAVADQAAAVGSTFGQGIQSVFGAGLAGGVDGFGYF